MFSKAVILKVCVLESCGELDKTQISGPNLEVVIK